VQVLTNERFIANKLRIGKYGTILGFVGWIGGLAASFNIQLIAISYVCLIYGFLAFNVGRYHSLRFGGKPRPDEILTSALKGLDHKHVLFNYVEGLPGSHLLLSPLGLFFIELRIHDGQIAVVGDRWSRKWSFSSMFRSLVQGRLGNPTKDASRGVANVKKYLSDKLDPGLVETVPVEAVVVLTDPTVELTTTDSTLPVVTPKDLRAQVRSVQGRAKMDGDVYRRLYDILEANKARAVKENESREKRQEKRREIKKIGIGDKVAKSRGGTYGGKNGDARRGSN
jgi:hypothetical protein